MLPPELLEIVKAGGAALAPVFLFLYWIERSDRKETQDKLESLSERTFVILTELKGLITGKGSGT